MERFGILTNQSNGNMEMDGLLSEAKALHDRVGLMLNNGSSNIPFPQFHRPEPIRAPIRFERPDEFTSSRSLEELLRKGRELDERVKRLKFELPSPKPMRQPAVEKDDEEEYERRSPPVYEDIPVHADEEEIDKDVLQQRPASAPVSRPIVQDELTLPTLRPVLRYEPGLPLFKNDPVRRYELYKKEWTKFPVPGENKHLALRWKVREYMLRVDLPSDLNSRPKVPF